MEITTKEHSKKMAESQKAISDLQTRYGSIKGGKSKRGHHHGEMNISQNQLEKNHNNQISKSVAAISAL